MSKITRVANLLSIRESEARKFCTEVQGYFKAVLPPCDVIADTIEKHGKVTPKEIAAFIDPNFHYTAKPRLTKLEQSGRDPSSLSNRAIVSPKSTLGARKAVNDRNSVSVRQVTKPRKQQQSFLVDRTHEQPRYDASLISAVADLISDNDKGDKTVAQQFLIDLERRQPKVSRLSATQLLKAIRGACKRGPLGLDQAELEVRKMLYGYHSDPDHMQVISIPMGGKTN